MTVRCAPGPAGQPGISAWHTARGSRLPRQTQPGPRVNKQGQRELFLTRVVYGAPAHTSQRLHAQLLRGRTPGELPAPLPVYRPRHKAPSLLGAVKAPGASLSSASLPMQTLTLQGAAFLTSEIVLLTSQGECPFRRHLPFYIPSPLWYTPRLHFCFGLDYVFQANILCHFHTPLPAPSGFHPTPIKIINIACFQAIY